MDISIRSPSLGAMHSFVLAVHFLIAVLAVGCVYRLAQLKRLPAGVANSVAPLWLTCVALLGLVGFELVCFKASSPPDPFWDFLQVYYPAGQAALHGDNDALRMLTSRGVSGFVNLPSIAYLFVPFSALRPSLAILLFTLIGISLTTLCWFILVRLAKIDSRGRWILAVLFLANGPLINGIKLGNTSYWILFALTGSLALLRSQRSASAGAVLGLQL